MPQRHSDLWSGRGEQFNSRIKETPVEGIGQGDNVIYPVDRFATLFDCAPDALLLFDDAGGIALANRQAAQLFDATTATLESSRLQDWISVADYPPLQAGLQRLAGGGVTTVRAPLQIATQQGHRIPVEISLSAVPAASRNNRDRQWLVALRDNSLVCDQERRLRDQLKVSEAFAHASSHDLKSPLRVIRNACRWLVEDLGSQLREQDLENLLLIQRRVARLEALINALEEFFQLGLGKDRRHREVLSGAAMIAQLAEILNESGAVKLNVDPALARVKLYRMPLQSVFFKLLDNAIKHAGRDDVAVSIGFSALPDFYCFAITDNGPGIDPAYHEKIFQPLQTLLPKDQLEASGMGLAIVSKILDQYGGRIELQSALGEGSTFTLFWPRVEEPE